jgi:hypothetical protein
VNIAGPPIPVDHDFNVIVEVGHRPITDHDVVPYFDGDIEIVVVVQRVDREAGIGGAIGWEKKGQSNVRDNSWRGSGRASIYVNGNCAMPFLGSEYAIDHRRLVGVSGHHKLLASYVDFLGEST